MRNRVSLAPFPRKYTWCVLCYPFLCIHRHLFKQSHTCNFEYCKRQNFGCTRDFHATWSYRVRDLRLEYCARFSLTHIKNTCNFKKKKTTNSTKVLARSRKNCVSLRGELKCSLCEFFCKKLFKLHSRSIRITWKSGKSLLFTYITCDFQDFHGSSERDDSVKTLLLFTFFSVTRATGNESSV